MNDRGYTPIDTIIREHLAAKGHNTLHDYMLNLMFALEGLRKWKKNSGTQVETVELEVDNKKFVRYPREYIGWTKIGIKIGDRIATFIKDSSISLHHDQGETNTPFVEKVYGTTAGFTHVHRFLNFFQDGNPRTLTGYGWGHNGVGFFREGNNGFQFSSDLNRGKIYLEFISSGFDPHSDTLVNSYANELIRDYIWYCDARFTLGDAHKETQSRYAKYLGEYDDVKAFLSDLTYEGIINATSKRTTLAKY